MKKELHPKYYPEAKIICACGAVYQTGSTEPEINVEICAACHPFYTGKQKLVDTARRVEKFQERALKQQSASAARKGRTAKHAARKVKAAAKGTKIEN